METQQLPLSGETFSHILSSVSNASQATIIRLINHKGEASDLSSYPLKRRAAVLVLLYERDGLLQVLLTTRSKQLRSHPGQTALPGGKCDEQDEGVVETALREALEGVGLPRSPSSIHVLCKLSPFISLFGLLVTPVIALLTDLSILDALTPNKGEVDAIFEFPLEAVLDPSLVKELNLAEKGSEDWPYDEEHYNTSDRVWLSGTPYRMHRFRSVASPVKGLTADILIMTAGIAFDRQPVYERWAPGQAKTFTVMEQALRAQDAASRKDVAAAPESKNSSREHLPDI